MEVFSLKLFSQKNLVRNQWSDTKKKISKFGNCEAMVLISVDTTSTCGEMRFIVSARGNIYKAP